MNSRPVDAGHPDSFAAAGCDLAATAGHAALSRTLSLMSAASPAAGLARLAGLAGLSSDISAAFEDTSADPGDGDRARLARTRALALLRTLPLAAADGEDTHRSPSVQKSGITG